MKQEASVKARRGEFHYLLAEEKVEEKRNWTPDGTVKSVAQVAKPSVKCIKIPRDKPNQEAAFASKKVARELSFASVRRLFAMRNVVNKNQ